MSGADDASPGGDVPEPRRRVDDRSLGAINPSTAMATTLVDELVHHGLRHVVVAPGSRSTALAVALAARDDVVVDVRHDERSAAFLALGLARASGVPAAVVTTSGTAVSNLGPAVAEAHTAGVPLLLLTADRPAELRHVGANQTFAQAGLFRDLVRHHVDLAAAEDVPGEPATWRAAVATSWAAATGAAHAGGDHAHGDHADDDHEDDDHGGLPPDAGGPAGPVHLDVGFREPTVPGLDDGRSRALPYRQPLERPATSPARSTHRREGDAPDGGLDEVLARVAGRRLLVVAGDTPVPVAALATVRDRGVPVLAEPTAGPHLGVGTPHASLVVTAMGDEPTLRPEVVLRLGRPTLSRAALVGLADVETVQVTAVGVVDPTRSVDHALTADPARVVAALVDAGLAGDEEFGRAWHEAGSLARAVVADHLDGPRAPEPAVARRVAAVVGARRFVVASSLPIRDVADHADATTGRVHANRGLAGIDGFTSTAVGIALAAGPTVALAGDLSFLHDHNGLLVEDPAAVPLTLVVVDNDGGGIFHQVPAVRVDPFERLFGTPHGRDLVAVARAAGVPADAVSVDDAAAAVGDSADGMRVLVVRTDRTLGAASRRAIVDDLAGRLAPGSTRGRR